MDSGSPSARGSFVIHCCLLCLALGCEEVEDKQGAIQDAHRCQCDKLVLRFQTLRTYADVLGGLSDLERLIGPRWMMGPRKVWDEQSWDLGSAIHGESVLEESRKAHVGLRHFFPAEQSFLTEILGEAFETYRKRFLGEWVQHPIGQKADPNVSEISEG